MKLRLYLFKKPLIDKKPHRNTHHHQQQQSVQGEDLESEVQNK